MALQLHARGIVRVRPLQGGLDAWRRAGLPLERRERRDATSVDAVRS